MHETFKLIFANNPTGLEHMRNYLKRKLEETTATILPCEETVRIHFLRGMAMAYVSILRDLELDESFNTKVRV